MSDDPTNGRLLNVITAPSSNYSNLATAAATIDLGNNTSAGSGDSDMSDSLTQFYNTVLSSAASGDGSSPSAPLNYVYIITDGVQDTPGACTSGHCVSAFNPAPCSSLQSKATVDVIYTTYLPIYANNVTPTGSGPYPPSAYETNYYNLVYPIAVDPATGADLLAQKLQLCASPQTTAFPTFYQASDDTTLINDLTQLFASTTQIARLTH